MKVGLVSNWDLRCGNAQYARDLVTELEKEFTVMGLSPSMSQVRQTNIDDIDVVIVNWHPSRITVTEQDMQWLKGRGKKVILILQNSFREPPLIEEGSMLLAVDMVVAHEEMTFIGCQPNFQCIQHGIPEIEGLPAPYEDKWIGTAGFAFPWKRFDVVAEAAKKFDARCRLISSQSDQMDTSALLKGIAGHLGKLADMHGDWYTVQEVVRMLAECTLNIFWFNSYSPEDQLGQSGSVRLGLAAKRPTIISTHKKLQTLLPYGDELYVCLREEDVYGAVEEILASPEKAKKPKRILEDMGWSKTGQQYRELVRTVCKTFAKGEGA